MNNKKGFSLYLTFLILSIVFMLVTSSQSIARLSMNSGRAETLECIAFHAADGGLEKGLAKLRAEFSPFNCKYDEKLSGSRNISIAISANANNGAMDLISEASIYEAGKILTKRTLKRSGIQNSADRNNIGLFMEVR